MRPAAGVEDCAAARGEGGAVAAAPTATAMQRTLSSRRGIEGVYSRRHCRPEEDHASMRLRAPRLFLVLVTVACAAAAIAARTPQDQNKVALVTVVADQSGRMKDLTAKDFVVTEDNAKRDVVD